MACNFDSFEQIVDFKAPPLDNDELAKHLRDMRVELVSIHLKLEEESFARVSRHTMAVLCLQAYVSQHKYGSVKRGTLRREGQDRPIAAKLLRSEATESQRKEFLLEVAILKQFTHDNVLHCYG